ncbi:MAG TPA: complex I subunit 1 family protein [Candidatus Limnocylindrales bacterium]
MTAVARTWSRLTLPGKILFTVGPLLFVLTAGLVVTVAVAGKPLVDFLATNMWLVRFVVAVTLVLLTSVPTAFLIIYMEMKVIALMNLRVGPDRVGPFGSLLSVVHGLKVLMKEDFSPTGSDRLVFTLAPVVVYMSAVMTLLVLPVAPTVFGADMNIALLYVFAIGGLTVVGLLMAGWSSFNKYSLLGGLRSAAQVVSYEIPLTLSVVGLLLLAGTMSINQIVQLQGPRVVSVVNDGVIGYVNVGGWFTDWFVFKQPLGALIFFIAATAEANRTPFDLTEADSEIVAGFATEYSGMRFGFFFFAEYVNVFVVSGLIVALFFGGWNAPFPWPEAWAIHLSIDPGSLGLGLLFGLLIVPPLVILALSAPFYIARSSMPWWQALILGFVLFNVLVVGAIGAWAFISWEWVAGLLWFLGKSYAFVFTFVWMRGTLPRVRIDQLMGFAWKWLLPAALLNLFVTAAALAVLNK